MNIAVISCHFNPCGYRQPRENFLRYVSSLHPSARARLRTIELVLDDEDPIGCDVVLRGRRPDHVLWQKEALLNAIWPDDADAVAWVDGDILFPPRRDWVAELEQELEKHKIVQLFDYADLLQPNETIVRRGIVASRKTGVKANGAWGLAWAARRDAMPAGLLSWIITGGQDSIMAQVWFGNNHRKFHQAHGMNRAMSEWAAQQTCKRIQDVGYLRGMRITHLFHGRRENRKYTYRDYILIGNKFNPEKEIEQEPEGHLRWRDPASKCAKQVLEWFVGRREDENFENRS